MREQTVPAYGHEMIPQGPELWRGREEKREQVNNVTAAALQWNEFTVLHGVRAVKFSPLMGGCLPIGEIKTKKTQCNRAATGGFGFAWLSARSMGLH